MFIKSVAPNMKKIFNSFTFALVFYFIGLVFSASLFAATSRGDIIIESHLNIQVIEDEAERKQLLTEAEKLGGYFTMNATRELQLRIPAEKLLVFLDYIRSHWRVYSQEYQSQDSAEELLEKQAELSVKIDLLARYQKMMSDSHKTQFFKVARAADDLVGEIETIKGRIAYLKRNARFAIVFLHLAEPARIEAKKTSSFEWINHTGLSQMIENNLYQNETWR